MANCEVPRCQEHYGCRLRGKGIQLSNSVTASKTKNWRPSVSVPPAVNAQIMYDERPGGIKMPILKADGSVLRHKEYVENKATIDATRARIRNSTPQGE